MSDKKAYVDGNFVVGVGSYYLLRWAIAFYPALVFAAWIVELTRPEAGEKETLLYLLTGPLFCIVFTFCISRMLLVIKESWPFLVGLYAITLYPFIKFMQWHGSSGDTPFPGVDWFPW